MTKNYHTFNNKTNGYKLKKKPVIFLNSKLRTIRIRSHKTVAEKLYEEIDF